MRFGGVKGFENLYAFRADQKYAWSLITDGDDTTSGLVTLNCTVTSLPFGLIWLAFWIRLSKAPCKAVRLPVIVGINMLTFIDNELILAR